MEINTIKLEDNEEYSIIETIICNNNKYLILNKGDDDYCVRKVINKNNMEYLVRLDDEDEFMEVITKFHEKYRKEENIDEK